MNNQSDFTDMNVTILTGKGAHHNIPMTGQQILSISEKSNQGTPKGGHKISIPHYPSDMDNSQNQSRKKKSKHNQLSESPDDSKSFDQKKLEKKYQQIYDLKRVAYNQDKMQEKRQYSFNSLKTVEGEIKMLNQFMAHHIEGQSLQELTQFPRKTGNGAPDDTTFMLFCQNVVNELENPPIDDQ